MQLLNRRICTDALSKTQADSQKYWALIALKVGMMAFFIAIMTPLAAQAKPCEAAKVEASGKYVEDALECNSKATGMGKLVSAACLNEAEKKFMAPYAKEDGTGSCETVDDAANVFSLVYSALTDIAITLGGAGPSRCAQIKLEASGEAVKHISVCQARALR